MMRGTYQVEFNIREREREKERALEENRKLLKKIEILEDELKKAKIASTEVRTDDNE